MLRGVVIKITLAQVGDEMDENSELFGAPEVAQLLVSGLNPACDGKALESLISISEVKSSNRRGAYCRRDTQLNKWCLHSKDF